MNLLLMPAVKYSVRSALFALFASISSILAPVTASAQDSPSVYCQRDSTVSIKEYPSQGVPDGYSDVQTYMLDSDFRSPRGDVPWSDIKIFDDPVTGKSVGVVDRNYIPGASRIHTSWYRDVILAEGMDIGQYFFRRYSFDVMIIPAGDKYLVLRGCNGRFPVNQRVATALSSMPQGKKIYVKLYTKDFAGAILNEIGPGTVNAWKKVYANWSKSSYVKPEELGF
jgi:hypothetical protein